MKHKLESILPGEISINNLRYADDTTIMAESEEELKNLLMKLNQGSEKAGLQLNIQKTKIMASVPITSWQINGEAVSTMTDFIFLGSKITLDGDCSHEIKRHLLLGSKAMTKLDSILKSSDINLSAVTAQSLQSYLTLCDPIDGCPPGSAVPGILWARTLEWVAIAFSITMST